MKFRRPLAVLLLLGVAGSVAAFSASRPSVTSIVHAQRKVIAETIAVSGEVRGQQETSIGAQVSGRVIGIKVREGDRVKSGQVLAQIDDLVLREEVNRAQEAILTARTAVAQSESTIQTAQAEIALASRKPLASDISRLRADIEQNVTVAKERVIAAQERLSELQRGGTTEQRDQITAQVAQAEATVRQAERDAERQRILTRSGAASRQQQEIAETAVETARQTLANLKARQREILAGARPELLAQARAEIRSAEATVAGARASGEAQLRSLLALPRSEDIAVARRKFEEAQRGRDAARSRLLESHRALTVAQRRVQETVVSAPFDGTITEIVTEPGGIAGPSQPLVKLVRTTRPEIRADVDEDNLGRLRIGQKAVVIASAYPGQQVQATVSAIGAKVQSDAGTVQVRLEPKPIPSWLRPGQTLSVNLIVNAGKESLVLQPSAVLTSGNISSVMVVKEGIAERRIIEIAGIGAEGIAIRSGLTENDTVVKERNAVTAGQRVVIKETK